MAQSYSLQVSGLGVSFGARVVLAQVDFELPGQGVTALLGPSGTGKSTLLRTLAGLNAGNPRFRSWGSVQYAGTPLDVGSPSPAIPLPLLVQQQARLMASSVFEALVEPVRERQKMSGIELRAWCCAQLQELGLEHMLQQLDAPVLELPRGQQRAVGIVREALAAPALLMADEPTAGLQGADASQVLELLRRVSGRCAVLMSTHNQRHAQQLASGVLLLAGGYIVEARAMDDFLHQPLTDAGRQFIATGSCSLPSPGARAEDLSEDMPAPRPLPPEALAAIAEFLPPADVATPAAASPAPAPREEKAPSVQAIVQPAQDPSPPEAPPPEKPPVAKAAPALAPALHTPRPATDAPEAAVRRVRTEVLVEMEELTAQEHAVPASRGPSGFHWLVPGRLAGTPYPGVVHSIDTDLQALRRCGITMLVTTTERNLPQEPLQRNGLRNLHLPIYDREPPTVAQLHMLLARMSALLRAGEVLAVHCLAGLGRTGTVLAAWLIRQGLTAEEALRRVRLIHPQYVQSISQEKALDEYETSLLGKIA